MRTNNPRVVRWTVRTASLLLPWLGFLAGAAVRAEAPPKTYAVQTISDVTYYNGADADKVRHKLDLYLPRDCKGYPVLMFVHGGAWVMGDKNLFGALNALGRRLARNGVGAVMINYRLSPIVKHPEHIKDVARAFAWVHKNIGKYGGRADQLFVCGHSAGGHLAALLGTDESYLKAEGLSFKDVKGVIPISGVYLITDLKLDVAAELPGRMLRIGGSFGVRANPASVVFGNDPKVMKDASPLTHVNPRCPPFLIMYGEIDYPTCDRMSEKFCQALKDQKCQAETRVIKCREHVSIIFLSGMDGDPTGQAILDFVAARTR